MRPKFNRQPELDFHPSNLKLTNEYYEKYKAVSTILDANPEIVNLAHEDLKDALRSVNSDDGSGGNFQYTSDTVLRVLMCQIIEGLSLRQIIIRIDDSYMLRRFVRVYSGSMLDYTTLCKLKNCISPQTWEKINAALAAYAVEESLIDGDRLRMDTTAVETNIHWPTDSSLLWDTYRVLARLIEQAREINPRVVGKRRLHKKKVKRLYAKISRRASKKSGSQKELIPLYKRLIEMVLSICQWADEVRQKLEQGSSMAYCELSALFADEIAHYCGLGLYVIDQASRRVLGGEQVPNEEKVFTIFEPHTELLKRGKSGKPIEFGHMIQIEQVKSKFITHYDIFENKPVEHELLKPALERHKKLFDAYPKIATADKGYYENMSAIKKLENKIELVSIAKKGRRTEEEQLREWDPEFRLAQRFRAGVEGTISFLKRILGLHRCMNKGWDHYKSTIGAAIFTHNVLILARM